MKEDYSDPLEAWQKFTLGLLGIICATIFGIVALNFRENYSIREQGFQECVYTLPGSTGVTHAYQKECNQYKQPEENK